MSLVDKRYRVEKRCLEIGQLRCCYYVYQSNSVTNNRQMLMLHGAGVGGQNTWVNIVAMLECWQSIVLVDFRGMGETIDTSGSAPRSSAVICSDTVSAKRF